MSIDYKNLSIEELDAKLLECDANISDLYKERRNILNIQYEKGCFKNVEHLIGKYIIMPGYYSWDSEISLEDDYILCKVEELKQPVSSSEAYFKLSNFIHVKHIVASYEVEKFSIAFLKDDELDNYEIHDIDKCTVLTDEEYNQKLEKIKEEFNEEFEKLKG
ncbi:MAG: hypothetical protein J6W64_08110 [Bacilli bacterium]|nr:hypothetical protein [Bacilli bacterium]